jgi:histidine ammonia-lyase
MTETLTPGRLSLALLRRIAFDPPPVVLDPATGPAIEAGRRLIAETVAAGRTVYGVNTGFGLLARTRIADDRLRELQVRLVQSHAAGTGPALDAPVVRLALVLKAASLAQGYSGVRAEIVGALLALYAADVLPVIPSKGSVGASGDLAPLAHLSRVLLGQGMVTIGGVDRPAAEGLAVAGMAPLVLEPKEGLALLNGTQTSTALALVGLFRIEDVFHAALVAGALSIDAAMGSDTPFDPRIHAIRGQPGQIDCARIYRTLLRGSAIRESHRTGDDRVQDPYSLRCQPQVMGACLDQMRHAADVLAREANAVTDNPLVFADSGEVLSGGNFHAEPVALAADALAVAVAEIASLSERRLALLIDATLSGLPAFLVRDGGLNSGFMIAQVTAAALVSENKVLAHPASVDSLPTSANQEDHVSMATFAARRLLEMAENAAAVVGIELLAAAQGIDFRAPLTTAPPLQTAHGRVRAAVPHYAEDRFFADDIEAARRLVVDRALADLPGRDLLPSTRESPEHPSAGARKA